MKLVVHWIGHIALALWVTCVIAQPGPLGTDASAYKKTRPTVDGIGKSYLGREIAGVMGWQAAGWLSAPNGNRKSVPIYCLPS